MRQDLFVTGTDTDAGKTLVCSALLGKWRALGMSVLGVKPVAAGVERRGDEVGNPDAFALWEHSSGAWSYSDINPILLEEAIAPHVAAQVASVDLSIKQILGRSEKVLNAPVDRLLVEGVGGWKVPLNDTQNTADLAVALNFPVLLVVHMRLGCLNHALLSTESVDAHGLEMAGWVANVPQPMPYLEENIDALRTRIPAPCWGVVPPLGTPDSETAQQYLDTIPRSWMRSSAR